MCDQHLEFDEEYVLAKKTEAENAFAAFMALDEEVRWQRIYDAVKDRLS